MDNQEIKIKVNELWDKFWSGGLSNPIDAIQQITYLLFMKQLDENDQKRQGNAAFLETEYKSIFEGKFFLPGEEEDKSIAKEELRWKNFSRKPSDEMYQLMQTRIFPFIKTLGETDSPFAKHMDNAVFIIPKPSLLTEAVKKINEIYEVLHAQDRFVDAQGDIYEYLLQQLSTAGKNGQFRTPTHIIEMLVELVKPQLGNKIADPACGTAGFLLAAYQYILTQFSSPEHQVLDNYGFTRGTLADRLVDDASKEVLNKKTFYGFDIDQNMIRIGLMNLMMHGIEHPNIDYNDTLSKFYNEDNEYHVVLANPPFTGSLDKAEINESFTTDTKKTELLFLERIYKMLRMGGTAGVIIPQGVLFGSGKAFQNVRSILMDKCELKAVVNLPSGVFKPYAGVATAILIFTKGGETERVWFYDMEHDGKTLDDKRNDRFDREGNRDYGDVHKIIEHYNKREQENPTDRTKRYFFVPKQELVDQGYDLSFNRYREEVYEAIVHRPTADIMIDLKSKQDNISILINELENML
ncbi:type I restriction enzyme M protein [Pedobacter psychrotolerans]|uniref:site-specific DNA-methyltransferase (adenine-specific) n=1 Tax=Pedobacter psychrotolerans TaxID=1843235 RepID=A0A4V2S0A8_9SPHI|nr:class I SAM-dependent DNA methyltransferase [Pedobacter psychrotolerans]TCO30936.1 type I restriction enzyme M protein [Pedobacter psychrotolerans]GGE43442.1 DNA methyltransferase [Pedobacter psychrotolerans]